MASASMGTVRQSAGYGIVGALNQEWQRLGHQQRGAIVEWAGRHQVFASCSSLDEVLEAVREVPDGGLHALLRETAAGQPLAGRVVLQSMLGRMVRMARRDVRAGVDDYVAALWCQIGAYPLARRPTRIAANLALDTLKAVQREHRWLARGEVTTWPPGELLEELFDAAQRRSSCLARGCDGDLEANAVLVAARRLELIDDAARSLLTSVYIDGLSGAEAADRHGTSPGSIRVRCSRAVERLSRSSVALAEAA